MTHFVPIRFLQKIYLVERIRRSMGKFAIERFPGRDLLRKGAPAPIMSGIAHPPKECWLRDWQPNVPMLQ